MLETMDDHGIVDLLAHHEPKQILVSIYALSKLQASCQYHERTTMTSNRMMTRMVGPSQEPNSGSTTSRTTSNTSVDLELLQDLYDCIPFATAAYGWKFNLATSGQWHK